MANLGYSKSLLFMWEIQEHEIKLLMCLFTIYMWKINYVCLFVWKEVTQIFVWNKLCKLQGALTNVFTKVPLNINGLMNTLQR